MGWNGTGTFNLTYSWANDAANGIAISSSRMDTQEQDMAGNGFGNCITRDAQGVASATIPFPLGLNTDTLNPYTASGPISVSAGQLTFPSTQNPSTDPHTLDDYAEGTFTPTITLGGSSTGITYATNTGTYTKIGNSVRFRLFIQLSSFGSASGDLLFLGLPFTCSSTFAIPVSINISSQGTLAAVQGFVGGSTSTVTLQKVVGGTVTTLSSTTDLNPNGQYFISGEYPV